MTFAHPEVINSLGAGSVAGYHRTTIVASVIEGAVLLGLWIAFAHGRCEPGRLGKVLSPQYLIWLVPLVPLVPGRHGQVASALLAVTLIATQWYFPEHYDRLASFHLVWLVLARDAVLLVVLTVLVLPNLETARRMLASRTSRAARG